MAISLLCLDKIKLSNGPISELNGILFNLTVPLFQEHVIYQKENSYFPLISGCSKDAIIIECDHNEALLELLKRTKFLKNDALSGAIFSLGLQMGISFETLMSAAEIPVSFKRWEQYLCFAACGDELLSLYIKNKIKIKTAVLIKHLSPDSRALLMMLLKKTNPGANNIHKLSELLFETANIIPTQTIQKKLENIENFPQILSCLETLRNPNMSRYLSQLKQLRGKIKLPKGVSLQMPVGMEGESLQLQINLANFEEFEEIYTIMQQQKKQLCNLFSHL